MTKPAPLAPLSVPILLASDLDTRVYWGPPPSNAQHALVLAALGLPPRLPPMAFTSRALITSDGHIMCDFTDREGENHGATYAGHIDQLKAYLDYLTTELQLTDHMDLTLRQSMDAFVQTSYEAHPTKFAPQSH